MTISQKATEFANFPVVDYHPATGLVLPTMPRREFHLNNGGPRQSWTIALAKDHLVVQSGTDAAVTRTFPSQEAAQDAYRMFVGEKIKAGYTEQELAGASTREAIIAALVDDPDDTVSRMAFADYLDEQGEQFPAVAYRVDAARYGEAGYGEEG